MDDVPALTETPRPPRNPLTQVPVEIVICVGKARPKLADLLKVEQGSVLTLDSRIDDPVELYVGDRLIARGELQEMEGEQGGQLAVRLTQVADLESGF